MPETVGSEFSAGEALLQTGGHTDEVAAADSRLSDLLHLTNPIAFRQVSRSPGFRDHENIG
jgi:hypothetical protein